MRVCSLCLVYGLVAQLVRAPPCHGGGRRFESDLGRELADVLSALILYGDIAKR